MKIWRTTFICLMFAWLLAGLISGQRIFFILFLLQLLLLASAVVVNIWGALSFAYTQKLSEEQIIRGRQTYLHLELHNEKPIPYPMMQIHLATADPTNPKRLNINLGSKDRLLFDLTLECPHRGEFLIGMTTIDFVDLFGLIRLPFDMRFLPYYREKRLLVLPRLIELESPSLQGSGSRMPDQRFFATDQTQDPFSSVRAYRPGDPRKLIHWKLSSRHRSLLTRQFDHLSEPCVLLLLDLSLPKGGSKKDVLSAIDSCCEATCAIILSMLKRGWPVQLVTHDQSRERLNIENLSGFEKIHNWLAKVPFSGHYFFSKLLADELATASHVRGVLAVTHDASYDLIPVLLNARHSPTPVQTFFTGPAAEDPVLISQIRQNTIPAHFFRNCDDLAEQWRVVP